ncbi:lipoprotein [Anaeromyxobacter paludicola]|uniref:Lipoprotein n=1 Tax=Anaeromyxobacter paludicola TaxID=2918171 RepID=A0ABM7XAP8_9BACT|nr:lipoprotein [Anaeromyxobacter paludicola]
MWVARLRPFTGTHSVEGVVRALDETAGVRVREALSRAGVPPRPERLWLLAVKDERRLELWAEKSSGERVRVTTWHVLAESGGEGPKLREGDRQVPEGIYQIEGLNPNSAYHLSLKVGYPNASDKSWAARDGRTRLGGDIFIHGKDVSIGCLAIGDPAIEELFWLAGTVGRDAFQVVIVPTDLRVKPAPRVAVAWAPELYGRLKAELTQFPMP